MPPSRGAADFCSRKRARATSIPSLVRVSVRVEQQLVLRSLEPATRVQVPPRMLIGPGSAGWKLASIDRSGSPTACASRPTFSQLVQGTAAVHIRGRDGSIPSAATTVDTLGCSIEVLRSASGEAMITAPTGRLVRSFSANERRVRLPPLRRRFWNVRCAVGATPVSRTGCPPGPGSTPVRSASCVEVWVTELDSKSG